ncbi:unnamed protein product [Absidia cylindrospora]
MTEALLDNHSSNRTWRINRYGSPATHSLPSTRLTQQQQHQRLPTTSSAAISTNGHYFNSNNGYNDSHFFSSSNANMYSAQPFITIFNIRRTLCTCHWSIDWTMIKRKAIVSSILDLVDESYESQRSLFYINIMATHHPLANCRVDFPFGNLFVLLYRQNGTLYIYKHHDTALIPGLWIMEPWLTRTRLRRNLTTWGCLWMPDLRLLVGANQIEYDICSMEVCCNDNNEGKLNREMKE